MYPAISRRMSGAGPSSLRRREMDAWRLLAAEAGARSGHSASSRRSCGTRWPRSSASSLSRARSLGRAHSSARDHLTVALDAERSQQTDAQHRYHRAEAPDRQENEGAMTLISALAVTSLAREAARTGPWSTVWATPQAGSGRHTRRSAMRATLRRSGPTSYTTHLKLTEQRVTQLVIHSVASGSHPFLPFDTSCMTIGSYPAG